jgi:hypothetical protein
MIVLHKHLFELTFEFCHHCQRQKIEVAGNVPTRFYETNPGWMLLTYLWLQQFQTNQFLIAGSNIVSAKRECVLAGVLIVNVWDSPDPQIP